MAIRVYRKSTASRFQQAPNPIAVRGSADLPGKGSLGGLLLGVPREQLGVRTASTAMSAAHIHPDQVGPT